MIAAELARRYEKFTKLFRALGHEVDQTRIGAYVEATEDIPWIVLLNGFAGLVRSWDLPGFPLPSQVRQACGQIAIEVARRRGLKDPFPGNWQAWLSRWSESRPVQLLTFEAWAQRQPREIGDGSDDVSLF